MQQRNRSVNLITYTRFDAGNASCCICSDMNASVPDELYIQAELPMFYPQTHTISQNAYPQDQRYYLQGPQGDPFAPQPAPYFPLEEEQPIPSPRPVKRKRKPRR